MNKISIVAIATLVLAIAAFYIANNTLKDAGGQNVIGIDFSFNHQVLEARGKNITIFSKPDNYFLEFNRPRIPLYSREIELPENASLERVEMKSSEMETYENAEIEFVPSDEHFVPANDSLKGFYPEQTFWYNVLETLDGRKKIELVAAPFQYNNQTGQAKVYSNMKIAIFYN